MSLPSKESSIKHYNEIPNKCLGNIILDIGSSNGFGALHSKHRKHFLSCAYLGIDIQNFEEIYLPIIKQDIFNFDTKQQFDTILMLHVLEHIDIEHWDNLFIKINSLLAPKGFLVINVPYREEKFDSEFKGMSHKVGDIDEKLFLKYLSFQEFIKIRTMFPIHFRDKGEKIIWPTLRFIFRILTNHKYSFIRRCIKYFKPVRIVAIYQKGEN